jgi:GTP-binding protein
MFKDEVRVKFKAGDGGSGRVSFDKKTKKATGGDGGDGGDLILRGDTHVYDLNYFNPNKTYEAQDAEGGGLQKKKGADGEDRVIRVPLATNIYDMTGYKLATIEEHDQEVLIAKGGQGGMGNFFYSRRGQKYRNKAKQGEPGEELTVKLELELMGDIMFLGFPNAGKSSVLKELTNANAKVAAYEFTTLLPQLGKMENITLMDLPGLIEGTSEGKGVGTKFVKHTRRSKIVAHFVSLERDGYFDRYESLREEIERIGEGIADKREIILLSKSDTKEPEERQKIKKEFEDKYDKRIVTISAYDYDGLQKLKDIFIEEYERVLIEENEEAVEDENQENTND